MVAVATACTPPQPAHEVILLQPAHPECTDYLDRVRDHRDAIAKLAGSVAAVQTTPTCPPIPVLALDGASLTTTVHPKYHDTDIVSVRVEGDAV